MSGLILLLAASAAVATPTELSLGDVSLGFSTTGGALTRVQVGSVSYDLGERSFTDSLIRSREEGVEERENLDRTDYVLQERYTRGNRQGLAFTGHSTAFGGVRIHKTFELSANDGEPTLDVCVTIWNDSRESIELAHVSRLILLPGLGPATLSLPAADGSLRQFAYPGKETGNIVSILPKRRGFGVAAADGSGFVFVAPARRVSAFYSWLQADGRRLASEEYYGPHWTIPAGGREGFILQLVLTKDVAKFLAANELPAGILRGRPASHLRRYEKPPRPLRVIEVGGLPAGVCSTPAEKLSKGFRIPIDILKEVRPADVGYHVEWLKPNRPIKLLYLPQVGDNMIENGKNVLNELKARLDVDATTVPLLREVLGVKGRKPYSVYPTFFGNRLDDWTMEELRKACAGETDAVFVQKLDFKTVQPGFVALLKGLAARGAGLVFYECANIPSALRGAERQHALESRLALVPKMNARNGCPAEVYGDKARPCRSVVTQGPYRSQALARNPSVPEDRLSERNPVVWSREFPFHDYAFLTLAKAVRLAAGRADGTASFVAADETGISLDANAAGTYRLETVVKDTFRLTDAVTNGTLVLASGANRVPFAAHALPGGINVAELRLFAPDGTVADAAAFRFETPVAHPLAVTFAETNRIFSVTAPVAFRVAVPRGAPAGATVVAELEDSEFRILRRESKPVAESVAFALPQTARPDLLERVIVTLVAEGRVLTRAVQEVSIREQTIDFTDTRAYITISPATPQAAPTLRELGFDYAIAGFGHPGCAETIRQYANLGLRGAPRDSAAPNAWFLPYRDDNPNAPAVREPCFSSPEYAAALKARIEKVCGGERQEFYQARLQWLGDECFLGSTVCFSPTCLGEFRADLKSRYGDIERLNAVWRRDYRSFDEVVPAQLDEIKGRDNLAPWLEHKMFMTRQFAAKWVGGARTVLNASVPGCLCGPTGTPQPGHGWDWAQMMKYIDAIGYYGGAQRKVIHDFAALYGRPILAGQCGGGYTHAGFDYEPYNYDTMWSGLLKGSNLAYHYFGAAIDGDYVATSNMQYWAASLAELKGGIGKLWLSGKTTSEVCVLYSQASLFAAMATCGKNAWQDALNSWWRILSDLKVEFRFYPYEALAEKGVPANCRVFVLPCALALSTAERVALAAFAGRGGCVLADRAPGEYDGAGVRTDERLVFVKVLGEKLARYNAVDLGGAAGESARTTAPHPTHPPHQHRPHPAALAEAGVRPTVSVRGADGHEFACDAPLRTDGINRLFALHVDTDGCEGGTGAGRFDLAKAPRVTARLPVAGHVYDVRAKAYVGFTNSIETTLAPGYTRMYSILETRPERVRVWGPQTIRPGARAEFRFAAKGATGPQIFHFQVTDPTGRSPWNWRENVRIVGGEGSFVFESALNDRAGVWRVTVTHVNTGTFAECLFEIPPADRPATSEEFRVRDPFIVATNGQYYLYQSWTENDGRLGVAVRTSPDLANWSVAKPVLTLPEQMSCTAVWAPEVHFWRGAWHLFVTLTCTPDGSVRPLPEIRDWPPPERLPYPRRGVWVFRSVRPEGPFLPISEAPLTPSGWLTLDGTFGVEDGKPCMVFCHEWLQVRDGRMCLARLADDLTHAVEVPQILFRASDGAPGAGVVTDGCYLHRAASGDKLYMIWSNFVKGRGYCVLYAESSSGKVAGPWRQRGILYGDNGGHAMIFRDLNGGLRLVLHQPNAWSEERMRTYRIEETSTGLKVCN